MAKKIVPKKNIEPIVLDIRKPDFNYGRLRNSEKLNLAKMPRSAPPRFPVLKKMLLGLLFAGLFSIVAFLLVVIFNLNSVKATLSQSGGRIIDNFNSSATALKDFEPAVAAGYLKNNDKTLADINGLAGSGAGRSILETIGNAVPIVKSAFGFLGQVTNLNLTFLQIAGNLQSLQSNGFKYFQEDGNKLVALLEDIRKLVAKVNDETQKIKNNTSELKNLSPFFGKIDDNIGDQYLKYSSELYNWDNALQNLINLLSASGGRHILVFFQNPSEIRPGGGFIGSYADITVENGQMKNMDVRDIYDPDGQLAIKIIPPEQLQTVTTDWGARDANWFFDFPTSAKTIVNFLEMSKMYSEKNVTFDAAIALNIDIIETLLGITGPIKLADYNLTIDKDNLLYEVQRSVEAGADKKAGEPKKILKVLAPILLQKLGELAPEKQKELFDSVKKHADKKDLMLYAKDPGLAGFLAGSALDGSVYGLPNGFWGSYLAVVNANIAGGKSDAFIAENVFANLDMDTNGNVFTNLTVTRTHNGDKEVDPWWKATNKDFIQIFTEPGASLVSISGNDAKPKYQTMNYANSNYVTNPDIAAIEKSEVLINNYKTWSRQESGKNVFATWLMLPAGKSKALNLRYQTKGDPAIFGPDRAYIFIFERQAGVKNSLDVTVNAPFRYYWAESGNSAFSYHSDDPDKRIMLTLTLKKQSDEQY